MGVLSRLVGNVCVRMKWDDGWENKLGWFPDRGVLHVSICIGSDNKNHSFFSSSKHVVIPDHGQDLIMIFLVPVLLVAILLALRYTALSITAFKRLLGYRWFTIWFPVGSLDLILTLPRDRAVKSIVPIANVYLPPGKSIWIRIEDYSLLYSGIRWEGVWVRDLLDWDFWSGERSLVQNITSLDRSL